MTTKQNDLKDLVPSLELCKKIPHPHFWNSALCWRTFNKGRKDEYTIVFPTGTLDPHDDDIPAPTMQEIMAESKWIRATFKKNVFLMEVRHTQGGFVGGYNGADLALQLWLKQKGVEL